jgi:hypothetical protein
MAGAKNENDGVSRRFLPKWDVQLEELNSLETARMRVCSCSDNAKNRLVSCR